VSKLKLSFACAAYDRVVPLLTGEVRLDGIDLNFIVMEDQRQTFDRMAGGLEFDACEMSSAEIVMNHCKGGSPFVAIPVFVSRVFRHGFVVVNKRSGVKTPKDLEGRRIGVPLYTMSAAVWIRGFLEHEYGVDLSGVTWVQAAANTAGSHGHPTVPALLKPANIVNRHDKSLSQQLEDGDIDAMIGGLLPDSLFTNPDVVRLFPNYAEVEKDYYKRTRLFPIMHLVAIRRDLYERHPFVATSLYDGLFRAKEVAAKHMRSLGALRCMLPWLPDHVAEADAIFDRDPWPYGIEPNRPSIEALIDYLREQGMIAFKPKPEDIFAPVFGAPMVKYT
jgi:4,5-dihydroxyphthalate decarboxylase